MPIAAAIALGSLLLVLVTPATAWAWGPPTHALIGSQILSELSLLPVAVRELLAAHPERFLYGNLSPDITQAKEYAHYTRHCHNWRVGFEVFERAESPPLRAFALGYLSHLAADTIAHNVFVPRQLVATPMAKRIGHTYWEYRFDTEIGDHYLKMARDIVTSDHSEPDELLERAIVFPFFSFQTNKRIFQNIIHLSNRERWHSLWTRMADNSKWALPDRSVERMLSLSMAYVRDLLVWGSESLSQELDPVGRERLSIARRLRRESFRSARRDAGREWVATPVTERTIEDALRLVTKRPLPPGEIRALAVERFPEPEWPTFKGKLDSDGEPWERFRSERSPLAQS